MTDLGLLPLPSPITLGRDGGQGGLLGGKILWTFGDTFFTAANPIDGSSVLSATSGWADPADPLSLVQPVDDAGFPAQLVPYTADELADNRADAQNGWALWPSTLLDTGDPEGLLIFQRVRRMSGSGFASEGVSTARVAVDATVATRAAADLFAPPDPLFMPALVDGGNVYAFACASTGFVDIGCQVGRAPVAQADVRSAYQFWDGTTWQPDVTRADVVIDPVGGGLSISWNPYLGRYLAVSGAVVSSTLLLRTAPAIEGPWSDAVEISPAAGGILSPTSSSDYDYLFVEHPELRSADGRSIVVSYSRPTDPFKGDVRLAQITFK